MKTELGGTHNILFLNFVESVCCWLYFQVTFLAFTHIFEVHEIKGLRCLLDTAEYEGIWLITQSGFTLVIRC